MSFDALTAGTALILVQLCAAVVMTGLFRALPGEKCTRYWALSYLFVALGVVLVILNGGAPRYAILILGNNALIVGLVLLWSGIRNFYKKPQAYAGWIIAAGFFICYCVLLARGATVNARVILTSMAIVLITSLYLREIISGQAGRHTFASRLAMAAVIILEIAYVSRLVISMLGIAEILPQTNGVFAVSVLYLTPTVGTLLFASALLLLYFERIVNDKIQLATHDDLTGVLNRRAIVAGGERELEVAKRLRLPLTIGFVDIDHFKSINDQYGHEIGDAVLLEVCRAIKSACRSIDLVGRYGGDEFCVVFPNLALEDARIVAERLVAAVNQSRASGIPKVTISAGMAMLDLTDKQMTWPDLLHIADTELYKAKRAGRNRVSLGDASPAVMSH